jgi:putative flippase GtrA
VVNGLASNLTLYGLYVLLVYLEIDYRVAASTTYVLGVLWNYTVNRLWSWKSDAPVARSFSRYVLLYGVTYFVHIALVIALVEWVGVTEYVAPLLATAILIVPQLLIINRYVFPAKPESAP